MTHPFTDNISNISPIDFEKGVKKILDSFKGDLKDLAVMHDTKRIGVDGTYQIDVEAKFEAFGGAEFVLLVECKKHSRPIERGIVQALHGKVQSTGAHKGLLCSTAKFQSGAIEYAKVHGIALVRVIDGEFSYEARGGIGHFRIDEFVTPFAKTPSFVWYAIQQTEPEKTTYTSFSIGDPTPLEFLVFGDR